ncbi:MAG: aldehyde ferredoxin oxidoreductase N-terminal domain-containing protein, partial [Pirellulales bacterium]
MARTGYHGRYLRIDLSCGGAEAVPLSADTLRRYLGGVGLGVHIMLRERAAEIDPLTPAAPIAFVLSPLVGSPLTTSAKFAVVSRSPLTDRINDALSSSGFALAAKRTGYDALVLVGKADRPSVLIVDNGRIRIEPAGDLWGMTTGQT